MNSENHTLAPISVCIAAHNEERNIRKTLESIIHQRFEIRPDMEVLVCANACQDHTADEVRNVQEAHPDIIRLIEVDEKGKPNAWNVLTEEARYDVLFFVDGDVAVDRDAFDAMHKLLRERTDLIVVAGTNAAVLKNCDFLTRITRPRGTDGIYIKPDQDYICGRMYGIRKAELKAVMEAFGYEKLPEPILHEDAWLQRLLDVAASERRGVPLERVIRGEGRYWAVCREAFVYFVPESWREEPKMKARAFHAEEQLKAFFPEYYEALGRITAEFATPTQRLARKLKQMKGMSWKEQIRYIISELVKRRSHRRAERMVERDKAQSVEISAQNWTRSETSRVRRDFGFPT